MRFRNLLGPQTFTRPRRCSRRRTTTSARIARSSFCVALNPPQRDPPQG
ncbi:Hypothetical protein A7982_05467 [Minicystis rosea]|nr:Hypothetical protein A7982_05467 [Minicystis rosea]